MRGESRRARRARRAQSPDPATLPWFRLPPPPPDDGSPVLVLGAGLGGCALARALAVRGRRVMLIERAPRVAAAASGNPAAVVKPFVTRASSHAEDFLGEAFVTLLRWLDGHEAVPDRTDIDGNRACIPAPDPRGLDERAGFRDGGALQLTTRPYPARPSYRVLDASAATAYAGTAVPSGGIAFERAGWLDPGALCRALLATPLIKLARGADVTAIERLGEEGWSLAARDGRRWRAPLLVLASGTALGRTRWTDALPLLPARGQISRFALQRGSGAPRRVVSGSHYAIPDGDTVYVGATFERGVDDPGVRSTDDTANRVALAALLPEVRVREKALSAHAGVRATTPDRLPLLGPAPDIADCRRVYADLARGRPPSAYPPLPVHRGLAVIGGFGSRGVVAAPLCAELLADWIGGGRRLQRWMPLVHPVRFAVRSLRRGRGG